MDGEVPYLYPERLKTLRRKRRMRARDTAQRAGISAAHLHRLERGERPNVSAVTLARVAMALGTSVEYLLGLTDDWRGIHEILSQQGPGASGPEAADGAEN
jgi:transcriptional regulator with XRE-family HTH domain